MADFGRVPVPEVFFWLDFFWLDFFPATTACPNAEESSLEIPVMKCLLAPPAAFGLGRALSVIQGCGIDVEWKSPCSHHFARPIKFNYTSVISFKSHTCLRAHFVKFPSFRSS